LLLFNSVIGDESACRIHYLVIDKIIPLAAITCTFITSVSDTWITEWRRWWYFHAIGPYANVGYLKYDQVEVHMPEVQQKVQIGYRILALAVYCTH